MVSSHPGVFRVPSALRVVSTNSEANAAIMYEIRQASATLNFYVIAFKTRAGQNLKKGNASPRMYKDFFKPLIDFIAAIVALVLLSPLLFTGLLLAVVSARGNPFFLHERPGYREKLIKVVKLKTMRDGRTHDGELLPNLKRITPIGEFLRKTSLDELPQLLNVLKGELSLVGPRPLETWYLPHYSKEQRKRHHVRPGITGLAQVSGRNRLSWEEKFKLDVKYVDELSLLLDVKILLQTVLKVFSTSEVYSDSSDNTMDAFVEMPSETSEINN